MPVYYQFRVRGSLDPRWSAWFDDLVLTIEANGDTTLRGRLADQAALYGVISKLRDVGLELIAVEQWTPGPPPGQAE
jgi:hypothetical protein